MTSKRDHGTDSDSGIEIRRAVPDDYDGVAAFTGDIWPDRGGDYIPEIYHDWLEGEDERDEKKTFLAVDDGTPVGIVQAVLLTDDEAWFQGLRVAVDYRGRGLSRELTEACFEWASDRGATVGRAMIHSWNTPSLGSARSNGYEPVTEFRFAQPTPDSRDASGLDTGTRVTNDPAAAWRYWTHSEARGHLDGIGLAPEETWALRELAREDFDRFADETAVFAVEREGGVAAAAYRTRSYDREKDGETRTWAEYGVSAWEDVDAARTLFAAIARDAADIGADETRVVIPETVRHVTDAAYAGVDLTEEGDFVLGVDLTASSWQ
ncbi:GNAT family N-acetyltransferase [Natronobacterium gregoryi]|uniref:Acetyltransferase (GNAT) family protein n=2 Tax=Natronobacterium gregoryi TaxID=44930 RepID=L0AFZ2_NATGS|nr:GNAT family N-acetyltransferase [Natronobacterium gregoryi]AFZ71980.1 acetyltransferase (GNAT) family protein [Natronobacterium gregoryi SP2]ELY62656.1 GCN5-like N-acetyltransferase [Natronobacterium gregoryi SP2]PLK20835.1 N-acetyltransferase [Natronobacterium gregoryi SP2]SFJ19412.1 Acetyltransferase (GNAT) family protein [Natronobacterium gregoryi]